MPDKGEDMKKAITEKEALSLLKDKLFDEIRKGKKVGDFQHKKGCVSASVEGPLGPEDMLVEVEYSPQDNVVKLPEHKQWVFTFGGDHDFPYGYIVFEGTCDETRKEMFKYFGPRWCRQYKSEEEAEVFRFCLLYTSPSPRDGLLSRMPSSA